MAKKVPTTKSEMMVAIAEAAGISKKQAAAAYDALLQIAYAGAKLPKGLMLPGLGKILKAKRKALRRSRLTALTPKKSSPSCRLCVRPMRRPQCCGRRRPVTK